MKARLIKDSKKNLLLLCANGDMISPDDSLLYQILARFQLLKGDFDGLSVGSWKEHAIDMALYPGQTMAFIADDGSLVINDFSPFRRFVTEEYEAQNLISTAEYGKLHNISPAMVKEYCRQGRIKGAWKVSKNWLIPADAEYPLAPENRRIGSGNWKKKK